GDINDVLADLPDLVRDTRTLLQESKSRHAPIEIARKKALTDLERIIEGFNTLPNQSNQLLKTYEAWDVETPLTEHLRLMPHASYDLERLANHPRFGECQTLSKSALDAAEEIFYAVGSVEASKTIMPSQFRTIMRVGLNQPDETNAAVSAIA